MTLSAIQKAFPSLGKLLNPDDNIEIPEARIASIPNAVTEVVIGQMLSRQAAKTIFDRVVRAAEEQNLSECYLLGEIQLKSLGLSGRKATAVCKFGFQYEQDKKLYENWRNLPHSELTTEVCKHWGLSFWTADMLGIFYFANQDVFPKNDGTIRKAMTQHHERDGILITAELASPYKTFLALTLWHLVDTGRL